MRLTLARRASARAALVLVLLGFAGGALAEPILAPKERAARLIARGDQLRAAGDSVSATAFYRDAISAAPRDPEPYVALGAAYGEVGELARAEEVFQVGLKHAGEHAVLMLGLARVYEHHGALARALDALRTFALSHPGEPTVHAEHARVAASSGHFAEALDARRIEWSVRLVLGGDESPRAELAQQIRALELLVASSDRARSMALCTIAKSPVRRALARCP